jgi:cytoskeletal protein CcmA (bactofilin family)
MFKRKQTEAGQGINTFVALETIINGNIQCQGCLIIDGKVNGDLKVDGDLIIGASGIITGNASANNITIGGIVEGNVTSTGILTLLATAKLHGDIDVGGFIADEGGIFIGRCRMIQPPRKLLEAMFVDKRNKSLSLENMVVYEKI